MMALVWPCLYTLGSMTRPLSKPGRFLGLWHDSHCLRWLHELNTGTLALRAPHITITVLSGVNPLILSRTLTGPRVLKRPTKASRQLPLVRLQFFAIITAVIAFIKRALNYFLYVVANSAYNVGQNSRQHECLIFAGDFQLHTINVADIFLFYGFYFFNFRSFINFIQKCLPDNPTMAILTPLLSLNQI